MNLLLQNNKYINKIFSFNFSFQTKNLEFFKINNTFRTIISDSTEITQYNPLTAENWVEKCVFYSRNECIKHIKPDIGILIRNDLNALPNLNFPHKKNALTQLCKHLSNWNCCNIKTCRSIRSEIDKMSLNPIENGKLFNRTRIYF